MIICRVVGHVWATKKEPGLEGLKLMLVKEEGRAPGPRAAAVVGAGVGGQVLVVSGSTARKAFGREDVPMDMAIVGIVDSMEQLKH